MRDQLLAYLLDDLQPEQRRRIEQHLANDPTWQHEYQKLKECLESGEEPPEKTTCPPHDLVEKTCSLVRLSDSQVKNAGGKGGSAASLSESREGCDSRRRWSLLDLSIAAAIFLAMGALLFPALVESRRAARRQQCQNNLKEIGTALIKSHEVGDKGLPHIGYKENAGMFVVELTERGTIDRGELSRFLVCPGSELADDVFQGRTVLRIPTRKELAELSGDALAELHRHMAGSYAYQFGYIDENRKYQAMPFVARSDVPILGDCPNLLDSGTQSTNHGGCGQNIFNQDGSSRFLSTCESDKCIGHPFLNDEGEHAAGVTDRDNVLGRSDATPAGSIITIGR